MSPHGQFLNAHSLKTFCRPTGKPRGIVAKVSLRLANVMKYIVQRSIVCNCDITAFLSTSWVAFVLIWAVNSSQRSFQSTFQRGTLISFPWRHISLLCVCSISSSSALFPFFYEHPLSLSARSQNLFHSTFLSQIEKDASSLPIT